jgi:hypothetical protein
MAVPITIPLFLLPQPLNMAFTQGILRVESTKACVKVYRQMYYNSNMRGTSVKSTNTEINIVLSLPLIMYGTEISYQYHLFINIPVCHVASLALTKARKQLPTQIQLGLSSGPLAMLLHKTGMLFIAIAESFGVLYIFVRRGSEC